MFFDFWLGKLFKIENNLDPFLKHQLFPKSMKKKLHPEVNFPRHL